MTQDAIFASQIDGYRETPPFPVFDQTEDEDCEGSTIAKPCVCLNAFKRTSSDVARYNYSLAFKQNVHEQRESGTKTNLTVRPCYTYNITTVTL